MILFVGSNMKWMMKINLCLIPLEKLDKKYTHGILNQNMAQKVLWRVNNCLFLRHWMGEGDDSKKNEYGQNSKEPGKDMRAPILVSYVIDGETQLNYFWGHPIYYISDINFVLMTNVHENGENHYA